MPQTPDPTAAVSHMLGLQAPPRRAESCFVSGLHPFAKQGVEPWAWYTHKHCAIELHPTADKLKTNAKEKAL